MLPLLALGVGCHQRRPSLAPLPAITVPVDQAVIVGRVIASRDGAPLAAAVIRLLTPAGAMVSAVSADPAGVFVVGPTPPGDYRLEVFMIVFRPFKVVRQLRAGTIDSLTVQLQISEARPIADCIGVLPDGTQGFGSQFCRH